MTLTRPIAWAAATDAGNRSMRAGGRTKWNEEDFNAAAREFDRLWPVEKENPNRHKGWFDRCVKGVERSGSADDPEAVCGSVLKRKLGQNPKSLEEMTAGELNKLLDKVDEASSRITREFIDAGRGHERPSEYLKLDDPLSKRALENFQQRSAIRREMEMRYGSGLPSHLPKGFGPRKRNPSSAAASMYSSFHGTPSTAIDEYVEKEHYHSNLAALGELVGLKVRTVSGYDVTVGFGSGQATNPRRPTHLLKKVTAEQVQEAKDYLRQRFREHLEKYPRTRESVSEAQYIKVNLPYTLRNMMEGYGHWGKENNPGIWPFNSLTRTTIMHVPSGHKFHTSTTHKGHVIYKSESKDGYVVPEIERDSVFDSVKDAKKFIDHWVKGRTNPKHKGKGGHRAPGPFVSSQQFVGDTISTIYRPMNEFLGYAGGLADEGLRKVGVKGNPDLDEVKRIKAEIRETKKEMKERGIRRISFMNAGLTRDESNYNARLFKLKTDLERAEKDSMSNPRRSNPDHVLLCSTEDGQNLQLIGGDQSLDLDSLKITGPLSEKELVTVGEVWGLNYRTEKVFGDGGSEDGLTEYIHILGPKETKPPRGGDLWKDAVPPKDDYFGTGELPTLVYDKRNQKLTLSGGMYHINQPVMGTSPGIEN